MLNSEDLKKIREALSDYYELARKFRDDEIREAGYAEDEHEGMLRAEEAIHLFDAHITALSQQEAEPVADCVTVQSGPINWLKEKFPDLCIKAGLCERIGGRLYTKTVRSISKPASRPIEPSPQPTELEMHRADYNAIRDAGFESPGELLDAYKKLASVSKQDWLTMPDHLRNQDNLKKERSLPQDVEEWIRENEYCENTDHEYIFRTTREKCDCILKVDSSSLSTFLSQRDAWRATKESVPQDSEDSFERWVNTHPGYTYRDVWQAGREYQSRQPVASVPQDVKNKIAELRNTRGYENLHVIIGKRGAEIAYKLIDILDGRK